jgi:hypothetical protein
MHGELPRAGAFFSRSAEPWQPPIAWVRGGAVARCIQGDLQRDVLRSAFGYLPACSFRSCEHAGKIPLLSLRFRRLESPTANAAGPWFNSDDRQVRVQGLRCTPSAEGRVALLGRRAASARGASDRDAKCSQFPTTHVGPGLACGKEWASTRNERERPHEAQGVSASVEEIFRGPRDASASHVFEFRGVRM